MALQARTTTTTTVRSSSAAAATNVFPRQQLLIRVRAASRSRTTATMAAMSGGPHLPAGVSAPPRQPVTPDPKYGFVYNAERLNSRACMLGFIGTLLVEAIAHRGVLELVGLRVGQGLGFEF
jgi:hypothetical protein